MNSANQNQKLIFFALCLHCEWQIFFVRNEQMEEKIGIFDFTFHSLETNHYMIVISIWCRRRCCCCWFLFLSEESELVELVQVTPLFFEWAAKRKVNFKRIFVHLFCGFREYCALKPIDSQVIKFIIKAKDIFYRPQKKFHGKARATRTTSNEVDLIGKEKEVRL